MTRRGMRFVFGVVPALAPSVVGSDAPVPARERVIAEIARTAHDGRLALLASRS